MASNAPPLDGVRVVDLTSYIAGSYAAMMVADLGAAVVKVESLEGDSFRELPGFYGWNRGKRSIALNLKTPEGREIVERLDALPHARGVASHHGRQRVVPHRNGQRHAAEDDDRQDHGNPHVVGGMRDEG